MNIARVIERVTRLLRLADPRTNDNKNEREIAAIEAAELIARNNLVVAEAPPPEVKKQKPRPPSTSRPVSTVRTSPYTETPHYAYVAYTGSDWRRTVVTRSQKCVNCNAVIYSGEEAFYDSTQGYRCEDIGCR